MQGVSTSVILVAGLLYYILKYKLIMGSIHGSFYTTASSALCVITLCAYAVYIMFADDSSTFLAQVAVFASLAGLVYDLSLDSFPSKGVVAALALCAFITRRSFADYGDQSTQFRLGLIVVCINVLIVLLAESYFYVTAKRDHRKDQQL